ncbi:MAG: rod shape-determining protein MreC [Thermodesulfobacteriota bacterium]
MHSFLHRYRVALSCGFFLTVSLLLATVNTRAPYSIDPVGVLLLEVMHPLQLGVTVLSQGVERLWDRYLALWSLEQENIELRKKLDELERVSRRVVELDLANRRLEKLLAFRDGFEGMAVAARVVGRNPNTWVHTVVLDKGERHGITKGMAVLAPEGVVGQVVSVSAHAARVLLISDPNSGVDALVQRSRVRGIATGTIDGGCILKYVQRGDDVEAGDTVITSGLDGIFPKGQPIGTVTWVGTKDSRMFQDVEVKLSAELAKVEEVLVVAPTVVRAGE